DVPQAGAVIVDERQRARGHVTELERGRAEAAQSVSPEPPLDAARDVARKRRADREERPRTQDGGLAPQAAPAEPRAVTGAGGEELAGARIIDGSCEWHPVAEHADRDSETGDPAPEVVGAVHWIEHPDEPRAQTSRLP